MRALITTAAILGFVALVWFGLRQQSQIECDVCFSFRGRTECSVGRGDSEASALARARTSACALLGSGVSDAMQCGANGPASGRCSRL